MGVISSGLNVPYETGLFLLSARSAAGLASPVFGPLSDRLGRRIVFLGSVLAFTLSMLLVWTAPVFGVALLAFALFGMANFIYAATVQAYIGDKVPYERLGLVMGVNELSWAAALFIGAPIIGIAISRFGWSSPFLGMALLSLLGFVGILFVVRPDRPGTSHTIGYADSWSRLLNHPAALGALGFAVLVGMANENVLAVYGRWMEGSFGLQVAALGAVTSVIGIADLTGEMLVVGLADRLGKRYLLVWGLILTAVGYAALPWAGRLGLQPALVVLFFTFVSYEMSVVASLPLVSQMLPDVRGTMMAAFIASYAIGRMIGAPLAGWLWNRGGFTLAGLVSGLLSLLALALVLAFISEARPAEQESDDAAS